MGSNDFRAKQFMPFDALKGFHDLIDEENVLVKNKKDLSDDMHLILNNKLKTLNKGDKVLIKYYYNTDYIETTGIIKKIDYTYKDIHILNSKISIDDIIDIQKI